MVVYITRQRFLNDHVPRILHVLLVCLFSSIGKFCSYYSCGLFLDKSRWNDLRGLLPDLVSDYFSRTGVTGIYIPPWQLYT